jgi:hypothetical protein
MAQVTASDVYIRYIRALPADQRIKLIALIAQELETEVQLVQQRPLHNIMEFHGVGHASWDGSDAQEYVNRLRDEWEEREQLLRRDWTQPEQ